MSVASSASMRKPATVVRLAVTLVTLAALGQPASAQLGILDWLSKLDPLLQQRSSLLTGRSRVVIRAPNATSLRLLTPVIQLAGGVIGRSLPIVDGLVADVPNAALSVIARNALLLHISLDRLVAGA